MNNISESEEKIKKHTDINKIEVKEKNNIIENSKKNRKLFALKISAIIFIILLFLIGSIILFILFKHKNNSNNSNANKQDESESIINIDEINYISKLNKNIIQ